MQDPGTAPLDSNKAAEIARALAAGREHHMAGRLSTARAIYDSILAADPTNAEALHLIGVMAMQTGDPAGALVYIDRALAARPDFVKPLNNRGLVLLQLGRAGEALAAFDRVVELDPQGIAGHQNRAAAAVAAMRHEEAAKSFRRVVELNPQAADALCDLASVLTTVGRPEEALDALDRALAMAPQYPPAHLNRGIALRALHRRDEALASLARALELKEDWPEAHFNLGNALTLAGRHAEAEAAFRRAVELKPTFLEAYGNLANALHALGRSGEAVAAARRAVEIEGRVPFTHCGLGLALLRAGDAAGALAAYDAALQVEPGNTAALSGRVMALAEAGERAALENLLGFDSLIRMARFAVPPQFASMDDYTAALAGHILAHPTLRRDPDGNATRKGRHTGDLLSEPKGPIAILEGQIRAAVEDYIRALPPGAGHPFAIRRPKDFRLAMWSVVLEAEGHQVPHIHPTAWLSGVCYAKVPPVVEAGAAEHAGWIEFGRPPDEVGCKAEPPVRLFKPEVGLIVLFPSYLYHRTVPFAADQMRISIAFDVMPA